METIYTVDYFIKKFEAIPENKWAIGTQIDSEGNSCALGHCDPYRNGKGHEYPEGLALMALFVSNGFTIEEGTAYATSLSKKGKIHATASINNGTLKEYQQPTPKQRILQALYDIRAKQQPVVEAPKERTVYVTVDEKVRELQKEDNIFQN